MGGRQPLLASWLLCQHASLCGVPSSGFQASYGSCKHEQVSIGLAGCLLFAHAMTHFEEASGGVRMLEEPEDAEVYAERGVLRARGRRQPELKLLVYLGYDARNARGVGPQDSGFHAATHTAPVKNWDKKAHVSRNTTKFKASSEVYSRVHYSTVHRALPVPPARRAVLK